MEPFKPRQNRERKIQDALVKFLRGYEWLVKETHGNAFQSGFPDVYATHAKWRQRWIEVKVADAFEFTTAQMRDFPLMVHNGSPIWVLTDATDEEYQKLFKPCNLDEFMSAYCAGVHNINKWRSK